MQVCSNRAVTPGVLTALFIDILNNAQPMSYPQLLFQMQQALEMLAPEKGRVPSPWRYVLPKDAAQATGQLTKMRALMDVRAVTPIQIAETVLQSVVSTAKGRRRKDACQRMKEEIAIASLEYVNGGETVRFGS